MFSARPSLDALATPTVAAFWLAPHFGQNAADPSSEPQALQNAIRTPPRRSVARSVTKDLFRRNSYCSRLLFAISVKGTAEFHAFPRSACSLSRLLGSRFWRQP